MCLADKIPIVIVPIEKDWFDLRLEDDGKYCTLFGKDKKELWHWSTTENPIYDELVLIPVAYEHHRSDNLHPTIIHEGFDDDGNKYLVIKREPFHD